MVTNQVNILIAFRLGNRINFKKNEKNFNIGLIDSGKTYSAWSDIRRPNSNYTSRIAAL
ncbi:hypothetical protein NARC_10230 [Candidatus Nitrosocosmicus arcticus]|uniref:Uncharacterized protein n=1 Tax=Candidatus Nitrosocosmicus arcticus TaxID=2035267 RepID=A0A557SYZ1_9ARCH|nr:hypothetical protein NARC_10230 [Candidatus Nitrosocosmicus arcticus]